MHIIGDGKSQIHLIEAAEKSSFTERFVASTWAVRNPAEQAPRSPKTDADLAWKVPDSTQPHMESLLQACLS
ncbi:hypothetical protein V3481_006659 [Fusarium oxysporum f. sp. vasinfectum]